MKILAIITLVMHYALPLSLCFLFTDKDKTFEETNYNFRNGFVAGLVAASYILTLIGLYILVCLIPEYCVLRWWLKISTILCWIICITDPLDTEELGCFMTIPATIGTAIWIAAL